MPVPSGIFWEIRAYAVAMFAVIHMTNTKSTNTMPRPSWQTALTNSIVISGVLLGGTNWRAAQSQPIADDTLGNERSTVVPLGSNAAGDRIEGGARRGDNLFHSFQEFSVDAGRSVYFSDPGVNNIITRVTGGNSSQINDVLGVLGNANLFLINPSGIIFGANAQLDVGGSFTATTADAVEFNNQGNFSATNPTTPALLTVQPSAFVFNQINPAPIANNSVLPTQTNPSGLPGFGLQVPNGNNLTLLGGNISLNGGGMNALGGRVEIGGLSQPGTINLNVDGSLSFPIGVTPADVLLANQSRIDVVADSGGSITINAGKFEISGSRLVAGIGDDSGFVGAQAGDITLNANTIVGDGALIRNRVGVGGIGNAGDIRVDTGSLSLTHSAELLATTSGQGNAGNVIINARDRVAFDSSTIYSNVGSFSSDVMAVGDGGDIRIDAGSLSLTNNAQLQTVTYGRGNAGNVLINVRDRVTFDNSYIFTSVGYFNSDVMAVGKGGDIRIDTGSLSLTNGAQLQAITLRQGNAGNVTINARDLVTLSGVNQQEIPSVIFTTTLEGAQGRSGDVRIAAHSIRIADGAGVSAQTYNQFEGGEVTFNTNTFEATGGGRVLTVTQGSGKAGNITLNARSHITLFGVNPRDSLSISGLFASTRSNSSGQGGTIKIDTNQLQVFDGAVIAVNSRGRGIAGNIDITANQVQLNNRSFISAGTTAADGGSITLHDLRLLQVGNGSLISTTAGTDNAGGNGGNIDIDSDLIVAFPNENSDISANAFTGSGGDVFIDTQGLFGIAFQAQDNPITNDITASSERGLQGNVNITLPEIDLRRDLTQLPQEVVDVSSRIAQGCRSSNGARQDRGEFIVKGRGGLPPSPTDSLIGNESLANWVTLEQTTRQQIATIPTPEHKTAAAPIVEAQAWIVDKNGKVTLIANAPTNAAQPNLICQKQENK